MPPTWLVIDEFKIEYKTYRVVKRDKQYRVFVRGDELMDGQYDWDDVAALQSVTVMARRISYLVNR